MNRRELLAYLGGAATHAPAAWGQQREQMRRIGVLMSIAADDPIAPRSVAAFEEGLRELGWIVGGNLRVDYRWGAGDTDQFREYAQELVALAPAVILATAGSIVGALQQASRTVPIVFVTTIDPVGGGWVASLARPGGNATGFSAREFSLSGKWLELLKELAPAVTRVAVIRDPTVPAGSAGFVAIQTVAPSLRVEVTPIGVHTEEIERGVTEFARASNGGLIVVGPPSSLFRNFGLIISLAAQHRLPSIYPIRRFVSHGGLMSYGPDLADQFGVRPAMSIASLRGKSPPTYRCKRRRNLNWPST
jgi:putative tryptophan/tyrosine transport system substrate-binding protein